MSQLNPRELDVLHILWKSGEAMTSSAIASERHGLTQSTVITVLRRMMESGLVEVAGVTPCGRVLSRTFRPTAKSKDVITQNFANEYAYFKNVISKSDLCAAILDIDQSPDQMKSEVSKLKSILADFEKDL